MNLDNEYRIWIKSLKDKIRSAQLKAAVAVNVEMIMLYWEIGKGIVEKQKVNNWGTALIKQMAMDLKNELPQTSGFSQSNLYVMRQFYLFYKDVRFVHHAGGLLQTNDCQSDIIFQQPVGKLENIIIQQVTEQLPSTSLLV
jgi:hypothetical protein